MISVSDFYDYAYNEFRDELWITHESWFFDNDVYIKAGIWTYYGAHYEFYITDATIEAYSAAGKTWFGWWLVEHYFSYHVDCPDGCVSGEPARGRKDPPYFQMSYGSFDHIPDLVDPFVESPLPA